MLAQEKADQAEAIMQEVDLDCWLTFARETSIHFDPGVDQVVGSDLTWTSAFIFARGGRRHAIVGRFDVPIVRDTGVFREVIGYDEGIQQVLVDTLRKLDPGRIGLNYSADDSTADGLTHGQWILLCELLEDTPYPARFTSAAPLLAKLRGRKSATEVERIRAAAKTTEEIVGLIGSSIRPGLSEAEIADNVHEEFKRRGLPSAWEWNSCPIVNAGPDSEAGHGMPRRDLKVEAGHLVHIDLGIVQDDYCSDLQRMWYVRRAGESDAPDEIRRAFATIVKAIEAGARALKPGVAGHQVDAAARRVIVEAGYPQYKHALGHGLGRAVHDGGTLLGPRWQRYGKTPEGIVEAGNVFTLELGVDTPAGYAGLEEDVLVTPAGCEFLSSFQRELYLA
jgi:Xaa-Pro aminopeptidase